MRNTHQPISIALVDDDPDDCEISMEILRQEHLIREIFCFHEGAQFLDFLATRQPSGYPDLILLDVNMPKMDGKEILHFLKEDARFRHIPVIMLTSSRAEEDVVQSYLLGANTYISKPMTFSKMQELFRILADYWVKTAELPTHTGSAL